MAAGRERVPVVDGWFTSDGEHPTLVGTRCGTCGSYFFPPERGFCRNPGCDGTDLGEVALSRRGTLWSYTTANFPPPPPYLAPDPFEPYAVAAVELERERMVVLGQVAAGTPVESLRVDMDMELVVEPVYADDDREYLAWKWQPVT
jgi:uncharacterized protein